MGTALVFAGASFIGRHLCNRLRLANIPCLGTSRTPRPGFLLCDLTEPVQVEAILHAHRPRWIFQCAGITAQSSAAELLRLHRDATSELLHIIRREAPHATTVLFGSAAEYGSVAAQLLPIREDAPTRPLSAYGQSKLEQTRIAGQFARDYGLRIHVVRPFNLLGPGLGAHYFAAALAERLRGLRAEGQSGTVPVANGRATRDWIDVRDVADAVVRLALNTSSEPGESGVYNIATGHETSVLTLADSLCRMAGNFHAVNADRAESRSEIERSCGDASRMRARTGWRPQITWRQSLRATWEWIASAAAAA
jgi:GDP-4-dehydro-6-deoxy-D-mannose reductase